MQKPKWSSLSICSGVNKVFSQRELQYTGYFLFFTTFSIKPKVGWLKKFTMLSLKLLSLPLFLICDAEIYIYFFYLDLEELLKCTQLSGWCKGPKLIFWKGKHSKTMHWCSVWMSVFFTDLSSPEAPICWGAPAGPVPRSACHVCVSALAASHAEPGGADWALWRDSLQNCAAGGNLHREIQRQEARGKQDPVWAVGVGWDIFCSVLWFIMSL